MRGAGESGPGPGRGSGRQAGRWRRLERLIEGGGRPQACGWLIDRYGLRWQIVPAALEEMMHDEEPRRVRRVTDAMLKMVKLDLAALEAARRS